jgi:colanic acid biosynthesis glycosyl transferase WcaI
MKILVYGINYYPELTGIGKYTAEMCEWFAARGHQVEVITAMPYYPDWRIQKKYRGRWWHKEQINGVIVYRVPLYVPSEITSVKRIIHEFSFACASMVFFVPALFKKYNCLIAVCPPFHLGFQSIFYQYLRKTPVIYHIQDLQVDAARKLGLIKNTSFLSILEKAEFFILRKARKVSSISEGMKRNILKKGIGADKYIPLPNWVDVNTIIPLPVEQSLKKELGFNKEDKILLYSGNIGEKQGLEVILDAALFLCHLKNLHFVFVGEGANKINLMESAKRMKLQNIHFLPLQPYQKLSKLLAMADLHFVIQKKAAADLLLPSKLISILSCGGLAIVTAEPETTLYELLKNNNIGVVIEPENSKALSDAIETFIFSDNTGIKANARQYASRELNREKILCEFEKSIKNIN